jgi:DNA-binding beta-propeller fold protein YncE
MHCVWLEGILEGGSGDPGVLPLRCNELRRAAISSTTAQQLAAFTGFSGDGGKATAAELKRPEYVVVDGAGSLFIGDVFNHRVRKVAPDGIITTYAGSGPVEESSAPGIPQKGGFAGDNGLATDARLNGPHGLAIDAHGNLFIGDYYNNRVRKVDAMTGMISTVAGIGQEEYAGDGGLATDTGLRGPEGLAIDPAGNLLIADSSAFHEGDGLPDNERALKVVGVAAPGLIAGTAFPR